MAYSTHTAPAASGFSLRPVFAALGHGWNVVRDTLGRAAEVNMTAHRRVEIAARLQAKSDEELAAMGLKREDIVHHVFRDLFWQ